MKRLLSPLLLLALAGCHNAPPAPAPVPAPVDEQSIVGSYEGLLPCADCDAVRTRLNLTADGRYLLQETFTGKSTLVFNDLGYWTFSRSNRHLQLQSGRRSYIVQFRAISPRVLQRLNRDGSDISGTDQNLLLQRVP